MQFVNPRWIPLRYIIQPWSRFETSKKPARKLKFTSMPTSMPLHDVSHICIFVNTLSVQKLTRIRQTYRAAVCRNWSAHYCVKLCSPGPEPGLTRKTRTESETEFGVAQVVTISHGGFSTRFKRPPSPTVMVTPNRTPHSTPHTAHGHTIWGCTLNSVTGCSRARVKLCTLANTKKRQHSLTRRPRQQTISTLKRARRTKRPTMTLSLS